jgi:DNA polymerase V
MNDIENRVFDNALNLNKITLLYKTCPMRYPPVPPQLASRRLQGLEQLISRWQIQAIAQGEPSSLGQFAQHTGLSPSLLSQYRAGKPMGDQVARQLEAACDVPPGWLDGANTDQVQWVSDAPIDILTQSLGPDARAVLPFVDFKTPAGFPSPAADFETSPVDLLDNLALKDHSTYLVRIRGQSMTGKGIDDGDLIVVSRKVTPRHGHIVVALIDNELTCKTLYKRGGVVKLQPANPEFADLVVKEAQSLTIWGVVTSIVKSVSH